MRTVRLHRVVLQTTEEFSVSKARMNENSKKLDTESHITKLHHCDFKRKCSWKTQGISVKRKINHQSISWEEKGKDKNKRQGNFSSFFSHMSITSRILVNQRLPLLQTLFPPRFQSEVWRKLLVQNHSYYFLLIQDEILLKRNIFWMEIGFFTINGITCKNTTVLVW